MDMYFDTSASVTILFKTWTTETTGQFLATLLAVTCFSFSYEVLKFLRRSFSSTHDRQDGSIVEVPLRISFLNRQHLLQALLNLVQVTFSYLLMLIAMSFNLWVLFAIIIGLSTGFLVFGGRHPNPREPDRRRCFE